jgi:hypothetical protein
MRPFGSALRLVAMALIAAGCGSGGDGPGGAGSGPIDTFRMEPGDCFDDTFFTSGELSEVPGVPCDRPHDNEVYATFDVPGDVFPGDDELDRLADEGCLARFEAAIGTPYEESILVFTKLTPSDRSWTDLNDREIVCVAYHMELQKLTGTVLGSGM